MYFLSTGVETSTYENATALAGASIHGVTNTVPIAAGAGCVGVLVVAGLLFALRRFLVRRQNRAIYDDISLELQGVQALPLPRPRGPPPTSYYNPHAWL